jgi:hypothetical protein
MVGDCVGSATMQAAWRPGEQPEKRFLTSSMRQIRTARHHPMMAQLCAPNVLVWSGAGAGRTFQGVRLLNTNMV